MYKLRWAQIVVDASCLHLLSCHLRLAKSDTAHLHLDFHRRNHHRHMFFMPNWFRFKMGKMGDMNSECLSAAARECSASHLDALQDRPRSGVWWKTRWKLGDMSCIYTEYILHIPGSGMFAACSNVWKPIQKRLMKGNERQMDTQNSSYLIELNRLDDRLDEFWEVNVWSSSTESENGMFLILWSWGIVIQGDDLKFPLAKIYQFQMFQMFQMFQVFQVFQFRSGF